MRFLRIGRDNLFAQHLIKGLHPLPVALPEQRQEAVGIVIPTEGREADGHQAKPRRTCRGISAMPGQNPSILGRDQRFADAMLPNARRQLFLCGIVRIDGAIEVIVFRCWPEGVNRHLGANWTMSQFAAAAIHRTPEFAKKRLADFSVNVGLKCSHNCTYCSSGAVLRCHKAFGKVGESPFKNGYAIIDPDIPAKAAAEAKQIRKRGVVQLCTTVEGCGVEEVFAEAVNQRGPGLKYTEEALREAGLVAEANSLARIRRVENWSAYVADLICDLQGLLRGRNMIEKLRFLLYPTKLRPADRLRIEADDAGAVWL